VADIQPLRALHYDLSVVGSLAGVIAPPYDVIDEEQRAALAARSPYNVVGIDLPRADGGGDPYGVAAELLAQWRSDGAIVRDDEPAVWAHAQTYVGPDGQERTRRGFFCRVAVEEYGPGRIRPHERTHPGPKEDRLRLTRATRANLSPIFSLYSDPAGAAWSALAPATESAPWGEVRDEDGTLHRLWRVGDPQAIAAVQAATRDAELLIADGHHRYETARVYAEEIGGTGDHRYVLMCLVATEDPGLSVFPTHRLVRGLDAARQAALADALRRDFELAPVSREEIAPPPSDGPLTFGYIDGHSRRAYRATLRDQGIADAALADHSPAYRRLDTGVLETLILKGALGYSDDDISHLHDFGYARDAEQALALIDTAEYDAAFVLRPTPVSQIREVAASGESMPPKSTYFYPKLLTGLLFNPLA
jgi:uncharacterized protein (DUF1015 family)